MSPMPNPKICVIIPCRGGDETLEKCVRSVLACGYQPRSLVVVDDGLDAGLLNKLRAFGDELVVLEGQRRGPSYGRTLAAGWTDADYVAFTDSDCIVAEDWLSELARAAAEFPDAVACGGRQELPQDASAFERDVFAFMRRAGMVTEYVRGDKGAGVIPVAHNASCNVMYKRGVYLGEGGFLRGLWPGEDVEFDHRLRRKGGKIVFNPAAVVYHYKPKTLPRFCGMMYRYGWAQGVLVRRYGPFRRVHAFPLVSLAALAFLFAAPVPTLIAAAVALLAGLGAGGVRFVVLSVYTAVVWNAGFVKGIFVRRTQPRNESPYR